MAYYEVYSCKSAINIYKKDSLFLGTINPYIGCEHSCVYCYVRAEKYFPYKDSEDFSERIKIKSNIVELLYGRLKKLNKNGIICIGSSSDPYQPAEEKYHITEKILNLLLHYNFYVHIFTKSSLILKDIDILKKHRKNIFVSFSIITSSEKIRKIFEPNLPPLSERFSAVKKLADEGIYVGCAIMPVLPFITDTYEEFEKLFWSIKKSGCRYFWWDILTLRDRQRDVYYKVLDKNFPGLVEKYNQIYHFFVSPESKYVSSLERKISYFAKKYKIYCGLPFRPNKKFIQGEFLLKFAL